MSAGDESETRCQNNPRLDGLSGARGAFLVPRNAFARVHCRRPGARLDEQYLASLRAGENRGLSRLVGRACAGVSAAGSLASLAARLHSRAIAINARVCAKVPSPVFSTNGGLVQLQCNLRIPTQNNGGFWHG